MEMLNLVEILKDCPKGTKLYCTIFGDVELIQVNDDTNTEYPIRVHVVNSNRNDSKESFTREGCFYKQYGNGECVLFPSKDNRDWSTFEVPTEKFNIDELKPFDKVLVRDQIIDKWRCNIFSHYTKGEQFPFKVCSTGYLQCVPYNEETKHLIGTTDTPPKKYINW